MAKAQSRIKNRKTKQKIRGEVKNMERKITKRKSAMFLSTLIGILLASSICLIPLAHATVGTIIFGFNKPGPVVFAPSNNCIYVGDQGDDMVYVIDTGSNTVVDKIPVGGPPTAMAFASSNNYIYVTYPAKGLDVIDTGSNKVLISDIEVGWYPDAVAFAPSNNAIYVANHGNEFHPTGTVSVLDTIHNTYVGTITVGEGPSGIAFAPSNNAIYVTNAANLGFGRTTDGTVSVIGTPNNNYVGTITIGDGWTPLGIAFSPSNDGIYVADYSTGEVTVIGTIASTFAWNIPVPGNPVGVAYAASNGYVYVTNGLSNTISVIDPTTGGVVETMLTGSNPTGVAFAPSNNCVYVASNSGNFVEVYSAPAPVTLSDLYALTSSLQSSVNTLTSDVTSGFSSLSSALSADFSSLSSAIANIGRTGPTVGTSNDATVASSSSFPNRNFFSNSSSTWTLISPVSDATTDRVVAGYTVSVTCVAAPTSTLYVSTTNTPSSASATYAIPIGGMTYGNPSTGQLRFPFRIPSGSPVYVQVVSSYPGATVNVQLQFLSMPINP
jgi:YVTN family beta-propeller protein